MLIRKGTIVINNDANEILYTETTGVYNAIANPNGYSSPNRNDDNSIADFIITKPDGTSVTIRNNVILANPTQGAVPVTIPLDADTKTFTPSELGYDVTQLTFPDGIYKFDFWTWYPVTGDTSPTGATSSNGKTITALDTTFADITTGFGDTRWIKVINPSATEANRYVASIVSDLELSLSEALSTSDFPNGTNVSMYAGYLNTVYLKVTNGLLRCLQPKMAKYSLIEQSCCKQCGARNIDKMLEIFFGIFTVEAQFTVGLYDEANKNIAALNRICAAEDCKC